jgi:hypothetical protein
MMETHLVPEATVSGADPPIPAKKRQTMNWAVVLANAAPILKQKNMKKKSR